MQYILPKKEFQCVSHYAPTKVISSCLCTLQQDMLLLILENSERTGRLSVLEIDVTILHKILWHAHRYMLIKLLVPTCMATNDAIFYKISLTNEEGSCHFLRLFI